MPSFELAVRGIIIDNGELLVFKAREHHDWWSLPGGKVEWQEDSKTALLRELKEETNIVPKLGKLQVVHEMLTGERHRVEWFYVIENAADFRKADFQKATHGYEVYDHKWINIKNHTEKVLPQAVIKQLIKPNGTVVVSSN